MEATYSVTAQPARPRQDYFRLVGISTGTMLMILLAFGCSGQSDGDLTPVPATKVNFTVSLADVINENLVAKGGYVLANNVIIAQTKDGKFVAVSDNCTFDKTKLVFKSNESHFYCPADLSRYDTSGKVVVGPATLQLTKYMVEQNPATGTLVVHN